MNAKPPMIIGIDPGLNGAIVFADGDLQIFDTPTFTKSVGRSARFVDADRLAGILSITAEPGAFAVVEEVHSMPHDGVASAFSFGRSFGVIMGVLAALEIPAFLVQPAMWKAYYNLSRDKGASIAKAITIFPAYAGYFGRKRDDGRAEAALLAKMGQDTFLKKMS